MSQEDGLEGLRKSIEFGRTQPELQCPVCKGTGQDAQFDGCCYLCEGLGVRCRDDNPKETR